MSGWDQRGDIAELNERFGNPPPGWFGMHCWEGLSDEQQRLLIEVGVLPFGRWKPERVDRCPNGAVVAIEARWDDKPGPRFYCVGCGVRYLGLHLP